MVVTIVWACLCVRSFVGVLMRAFVFACVLICVSRFVCLFACVCCLLSVFLLLSPLPDIIAWAGF